MRFLCLHGLGTNADIFEIQTEPLREELGDCHEFDFLNGEYEVGPAPGIDSIFPGPYFSWHILPSTVTNTRNEIDNIKKYIAENGPYDGAMGFSQGAMMLMALMLEHQSSYPFEPALFQVAIFFCGGLVPELKQLADNGLKVRVPTAHILGGKKDSMYEESLKMRDACDKDMRSEYEHNEGHCIPRNSDQIVAMTKTIRKTIDRAVYKS